MNSKFLFRAIVQGPKIAFPAWVENSIFRIKYGKTYFNERVSRNEGRGDTKKPRLDEGEPRFLMSPRPLSRLARTVKYVPHVPTIFLVAVYR